MAAGGAAVKTATSLGLDSGARSGLKRLLADASAAGRARQVAAYVGRRKRLAAIDRKTLSQRDLTFYDTVDYAQGLGAQGGKFTYGEDNANPYVVSQQNGAVSTMRSSRVSWPSRIAANGSRGKAMRR